MRRCERAGGAGLTAVPPGTSVGHGPPPACPVSPPCHAVTAENGCCREHSEQHECKCRVAHTSHNENEADHEVGDESRTIGDPLRMRNARLALSRITSSDGLALSLLLAYRISAGVLSVSRYDGPIDRDRRANFIWVSPLRALRLRSLTYRKD